MVIATIVTTVIALFYSLFWCASVLNHYCVPFITLVSTHILYYFEERIKTPIDLFRKAFGDKSLQCKTMLISVPQLGITLLVLACPNWQST
jgi:hypothetical protein